VTGDLVRIAFAATIVAFTLKYARSDCTEVIRFLTWFALAPYALARALTPQPREAGGSIRLPLGPAQRALVAHLSAHQ
jgi:hypothetical protein